jgi:hypothetical protein
MYVCVNSNRFVVAIMCMYVYMYVCMCMYVCVCVYVCVVMSWGSSVFIMYV